MAQTHFGYQRVSEEEKSHKVAQVFDSVAQRYDMMNDLMSLGFHRWWKRFTVAQSGVRVGQRVLDVAGGTGDLTLQFAKLVGKQGQVWLSDINASMLQVGRDRLLDAGIVLPIIQSDAENLPFPTSYFDCVSVAFGLRNMTHKDRALKEFFRVLRPGGRLIILEFSQVWKPLQKIYDLYSFNLLPLLGQYVARDAQSYRYLAESIRMHPTQQELQKMMQEAEFERVEYFNLVAGVVALHRGYKL